MASNRTLQETSEKSTFVTTHRRSSSDSPSSDTSMSRLLRSHESAPREQPASSRRIGTPASFQHNSGRRYDSPVLGAGTPRTIILESSQTPQSGRRIYLERQNSNDAFLPTSDSRRDTRFSVTSVSTGDSSNFPRNEIRHTRTPSAGSMSLISRTSSLNEYLFTASRRPPSSASEARIVPHISRSSTRRSRGQEWTRHHWDKIQDLEQESDRARRCSKLSSGFAPLMVFGGLVFVCIGISASTNTGKDQVRLKRLSVAPMAMGAFMLALGVFLIFTWFGCRAKARQLDRKVLYGSRRRSTDGEDNMVEAVLAKLYSHIGTAGNRPETPTLPGVTMDGIVVHKEQNINASSSNTSDANAASSSRSFVIRETTV